MPNMLQKNFSMIRTREELLNEISRDDPLRNIYHGWNEDQQNEFLDFCTGVKGVKILYDAFFKEVMDPSAVPERLNELLSLILNQKIRILNVLPNESPHIAEETSLVIMDIVVELENRSLANIEIQRQGYMFPGQRAACYSADLLLRQYKRIRSEKNKAGRKFSYRDIKKVYTIIFYDKSPMEFHQFPNDCIHRARHKTDTGLEIDLLQEYAFIPLDICRKILHNKGINSKLEAWLVFLSSDDPEWIIRLSEKYPQFRTYYEEIYMLCLNTEKVMSMFSKELQELDRNTVQYMIDTMQEEIDKQRQIIGERDAALLEKEADLAEKDQEIKELKAKLAQLQ
ncbi:Rpn family recombination-promoting nuclease/putative transposase [Ruminococcus sp. CLA-AA-H200]|uniref:Rpn family recombination-promoting nuclease/putative transposase n=1 Tax=Ruminococcus turbiniformis TaxID=2881258 RepID=A0ABS8FTP2_9FIRM|nr:Rpn family recombination-promoting nuclease/putative transposase [Ruminococcus turbiniformis]MCC2253343.1 Rpn family recombination-promoting nuclease/putative transposase [Ruminococcus turbiniformis]